MRRTVITYAHEGVVCFSSFCTAPNGECQHPETWQSSTYEHLKGSADFEYLQISSSITYIHTVDTKY